MAKLIFAKISVLHYEDGAADIAVPEYEDQVIEEVPFLSWFYEMPKVGDTVAALLEFDGGNYDKGIILGPFYNPGNKPEKCGKDIFWKGFKDGAGVLYDRNQKTLTTYSKYTDREDP